MASRSYVAQEIKTNDPGIVIEVKVRYAGKPEYSGAEQQGYWVSVVPVKRKEEVYDGVTYVIRTVGAYTGVKSFLAPAVRYSEKTMLNLPLDQAWIDSWAENKAASMGLEIIKEATSDNVVA